MLLAQGWANTRFVVVVFTHRVSFDCGLISGETLASKLRLDPADHHFPGSIGIVKNGERLPRLDL